MKHAYSFCLRALTISFFATLSAYPATFTTDSFIGINNTNFDGQDIAVTNCMLTVDGTHAFSSVLLQTGAVLTHSFSTNALLENRFSVSGELHALSSTNPAVLNSTNILSATVVVTNPSGGIFQSGTDYGLVASNNLTYLTWLTGSAIADGATISVSYDFLAAPVAAGLFLTISNDFQVDSGAAINANGGGYGGGLGPGAGSSLATNYPYPYIAGSGGGHGGYGAPSSSRATGGNFYGSPSMAPAPGSGGGPGSGPGGSGGGIIQLSIGGLLRLDGHISADGIKGVNPHSGGGAGGGVFLSAYSFSGSGSASADGGAGESPDGGGGGGGRIAIYSATNNFTGSISAHGGASAIYGGAGSIYTLSSNDASGALTIDNGGHSGTNTPLSLSYGFNLTIGGGAVVQGTSSTLSFGNVLIRSNGWLTAVGIPLLAPILLTCSNAVVMQGGGIDADGKGFAGGQGSGSGHTSSSEAGGTSGGGASYGGFGGRSASGAAAGLSYGSPQQPLDFGSGGGSGAGAAPYNVGGAGGGAIRLNVAGTLTLDGRISANGNNGVGQGSGGGSGGSILLTVGNFAGAGLLAANGGAGESPFGGGGGGGRIAVYYGTNQFSGIATAYGGAGANNGGAGTVYSRANSTFSGQMTIDNNGLLATNTVITLQGDDLTIAGSAAVTPSTFALSIKTLLIRSNSWLTFSNTTHSGLVVTVTSNAIIEAGAGIMLDGKGYGSSQGPGTGGQRTGGGAGFGGYGGNSASNSGGGNSYGSYLGPLDVGSGGGYYNNVNGAGSGGGAIHLIVSGSLTLDGTITANGTAALVQGNGGGSGGAVWLNAGKLFGAGLISANGGPGGMPSGGGGGGGRIAIYYTSNLFTGTITARGGGGANYGGAGTLYLSRNNSTSSQLIVDNGGPRGTNTPANSSAAAPGFANLTVSGGATVYSTLLSGLSSLQISSNSMVIYSNGTRSVTTASNMTIQAGGAFILDGMGYGPGAGPGAGHSFFSSSGNTFSSGGGYGGFGGNGAAGPAGGNAYGSLSEPLDFGSGGGVTENARGGSGGGVLHLSVPGTLLVDGCLTANGLSATGLAGGGAGGSLWLTVGTLSGRGAIAANGGAGALSTSGGGGGGRIAIYYAITNLFKGSLTAQGGAGFNYGGAGTIYLNGLRQLSSAQVLVDNGGHPGTNTLLGNAGLIDLSVRGGGSLLLSSSAILRNLLVLSNSWITVASNQVLQLIVSNAIIQANGGITMDALSYSGPGNGGFISSPFYGITGGGGGYGGFGGTSAAGASGGNSYGSILQPLTPGSSAGPSGVPGTPGGGAMKLTVAGTLQLDGRISANGGNAVHEGGGGGSGGSIWLNVGTLSGSGSISVNGGTGDSFVGGGGGGGRIATYFVANNFSGTVSAYGGLGAAAGGAGTIYSRKAGEPVGKVVIDNFGVQGTNTPLASAENFALTLSGNAVVYPSTSPMALSSLLIDSGATFTHLGTQSNLDLTVFGNAIVQTNGFISVDAKGYNGAAGGPGAGLMLTNDGSGGGYGGTGGASASGITGGVTYGSASQPTDRGSRGGLNPPYVDFSQGGGAVRMRVSGNLTVNGEISANGNSAFIEGAGGGAGGSIWLTSREIDGSGLIVANGGNGEDSGGGGGGGGRIAINTRSNNFVGDIYAAGGLGANPGQDGTVVVTNIPAPQIIAQSPSDIVNSKVSSVDLTFSSLMNFTTAFSDDFSLDTPNGLLAPGSIQTTSSNLTAIHLTFPTQSDIGYYELQAGPLIEDIYGQTMPTAYIGSFIILPPEISGHVLDSSGSPVPFVTLRPDGGLLPIVTDTHGAYSLEVPLNWVGTITPFRGSSLFVPASHTYTNVTSDLTNQDFVLIKPANLTLSIQQQDNNFTLSWNGIAGVYYQISSSTDMINWIPYNTFSGGTGPMTIFIPTGPEPAKFFRFRMSY